MNDLWKLGYVALLIIAFIFVPRMLSNIYLHFFEKGTYYSPTDRWFQGWALIGLFGGIFCVLYLVIGVISVLLKV